MSSEPYVVAVVLTWNDIELARDCIASLYKSNYSNYKVVLVDNGSSFPVVPVLEEEFPDLITVPLDENYGFTGGCNRGMEKALDMGADYVFLLNNDTVVGKNAISELVSALEQDKEVGFASALLLYGDEPKRVFSLERHIVREKAKIERVADKALWEPSFSRIIPTGFMPACAKMFRRYTLEDVGLFDESLFTNWEDYDWCVRMEDAGWKGIIAGAAEVIHLHGQTTGRASPFITYLFARNKLICLFRHAKKIDLLKNSPYILRTYWWQVKGYGLSNWACHKALFVAFCDFLLGVRGKGRVPKERNDSKTRKKVI